MEYMDGGNLADRLDSHPDGLPINEALWIAECLCKGLKLAHDNGVAHLDLKPENILFRETPNEKWDVPKIADWGLARSLLADSQSMDMLSVEYAAPEQFKPDEFGKPDSYTDIYQVGAVIYEMLTGELPYPGEPPEIMHGVIDGDDPDPPSTLREQLPHAVDDIVLKALSTEKPQRYRGSVDRLGDAIRDICHSADQGNTLNSPNSIDETKIESEPETHSTEHSKSWPQLQFDAAQTGYQPNASTPVPPVTDIWTFETGNLVRSSPAVANGTVFVGSRDNHVYALDAATGDKQWAFETVHPVRSSPAVADGIVFVGSRDNHMYALDAATGDKQWTFEISNWVTSSPAVADGTVFLGSDDNTVYALDAATGDKQWTFEISNWVTSWPAVVDDTVYVGSDDNTVYALDAATGDEQWAFETGIWITSSPAVADSTVFVGSDDNTVYALDAATGDEQWAFETDHSVRSSPAVADSTVFVGSDDHNLYALDAATGDKQWAFETGHMVRSSPAVADGTVFVGSDDHNLYALE
jgi:outer membrane protein assembly factor BamB